MGTYQEIESGVLIPVDPKAEFHWPEGEGVGGHRVLDYRVVSHMPGEDITGSTYEGEPIPVDVGLEMHRWIRRATGGYGVSGIDDYSCSNCAHWHSYHRKSGVGQCRKDPPALAPGRGSEDAKWKFAESNESDYCGGHTPVRLEVLPTWALAARVGDGI